MFDFLRHHLLRALRVPPEPEPPAGAPASVRIFRAGRRHYQLRLLRWSLAQLGAIGGIAISLYFLHNLDANVAHLRTQQAEAAATPPPAVTPAAPSSALAAAEPEKAPVAKKKRRPRVKWEANTSMGLEHAILRAPWWVMPLVKLFEFGGILLFLAQVPITFAAVRLEFEQHWYIVTDRSLRIRTGVFRLSESTMSFANLQQVEVKQGPLQRLLGLADVRVQSAGGGGGGSEQHGGAMEDSLHTAVFHSVTNASAIRDLILDRLRRFRQAGLGDPDDSHHPSAAPAAESGTVAFSDPLAAAQELLAEARALRQRLS